MEKVVITFNDGIVVKADKNGDSYIVDEKPSFPEDLGEVVVTDEKGDDTVLEKVQIIDCASVDGRYWFALREMPEAELAQDKTDAQVLYTALMTDTLLEED